MTRLTPEAKKPARIDWKRSFDEAEEKRHKAERQLAAVTAERDALRVDAERLAWRPIETAPQDGVLLLWFPAMATFVAGPWRGCWSYLCDEWVIHTPYSAGEKAIVASALPQPTHWMPLPPAIDAARGAQ